jgi:hypothetical protein
MDKVYVYQAEVDDRTTSIDEVHVFTHPELELTKSEWEALLAELRTASYDGDFDFVELLEQRGFRQLVITASAHSVDVDDLIN